VQERDSPSPGDPEAPSPAEARPASSDGLPDEVRARLPERDPVALQAFFDAYFDRVYGYIRRLVRDEHLAEDLTQDVFLHVHRAFDTYDATRALKPWVFTIATNKLRDHWRSRRHREAQTDESVERDGLGEEIVTLQPRAVDVLTEAELAVELQEAIEELPEGMRVTVQLRVYEELSFEEIGAILERTEVAVRKRYSRALEALRGAMGPAWQLHTEEGR